MNVPKLRFKEFNDEYIEKKLSEIVQKKGGGTPNTAKITYWQGTIPWISSSDLSSENILSININRYISQEALKKSATNLIPKNSVLIVTRVGVGKVATNKIDICTSQDFTNLINFSGNSCYLAYILKRKMEKFQKTTQGTSIKGITSKELMNLDLNIPSLNEQIKVAKFLILLDKKIELQTKKIEDLKLFKKGLFTNLKFNNMSLITFKDILDEVNEKSIVNNQYEILSSTAHGLFLQKEYFNKQAASDNNIGYKILRKNQLVLSPQNLWMGNININNKYNIRIVSPSYKIFKINENIINIDYFNNWIKSPRALYEYIISSEQGASIVRRNLNMDLFNEITLKIPNMQTQKKIGKQINNINNLIELENSKLGKLKKLKKGLMQSMFV